MSNNKTTEEQPVIPPDQYIFIPDSQYSIDKSGDVYKNNVLTICPYAPKLPIQKKVQNIHSPNQGLDLDNHFIHHFPCTIKCPKCNVVAMQNATTNQVEGFALQITCNGTLDQFALPVIAAEAGNDSAASSPMSVVK